MLTDVSNAALTSSLAGEDLGGYGGAMVVNIAAQMCDLGEASPQSSNTAMQRLMRLTQDQPAPGQRISLGHLQALMAASTGAALPGVVAKRMGDVLGHDFSRVRIHTDSAASRAAKGISAHAFTTERDIYFGPGTYRPGTKAGDALLAHELTHVIQHDQGRIKGNGVSHPSDPLEREAEDRSHEAVQALAGADIQEQLAQDAPAAARQLGKVVDANGKRAQQTQQLVRSLVRALGLPAGSVQVRVDDLAARETEHANTRGLMKGGEVLLHPDRFDPGSADGRSLLAHEVAHIAQEGLEPAAGAGAGRLAEAEAHQFADSFAAGGAMPSLSVGLPTGHVAAEGPAPGADLQQLIAQHRETATANAEGITTPEPTANTVGDNGTEDRERKVSRYQDGVDGIADQIGDLDAFDDLCDAVSDEEDTGPALAQIRASEPYKKLCDMWQGAKEGGPDRPAMEEAFNYEFDGRGFWGSTEQAFDLVEAAAKRDARPHPEAAAARQRQAEAETGAVEGQEQVEAEESEGSAGPGAAENGAAAGEPGAVDPALLNASVPEQIPELSSYTQLTAVTDEELGGFQDLLNHRQGLASEVGGAQWDDRLGQVSEAFWDGLSGSFVSSFTDQMFDTLVLDTIGTLADKGLTLASRGAFRVPFVGPLIGILMTKPWEAESLGQWASGAFGVNSMTSESAAALFSAETWTSGWEHVDSVGDFFGVLIDKFADLFEGLRDIVKGLKELAGTLSALAYITGGILIGVGLALIWLAGVGAPLITAGTWLVNAGTILGRVATALGAIELGLSLLGAVFRAAAALLVPAEMYADQLAGVGSAASAFGTAAGNKAGDVTATHVKDAASARFSPRGADTEAQGRDEGASGQADGRGADQRVRDNEAGLQQVRDQIDTEIERQRTAEAEAESQTPRTDDPDGPNRTPDGEDGPTGRQRMASWGRDMARILNPIGNIRRGLGETVEGLREAQHALRSPGEAAAEALDPRTRQMIEERINQKRGELQTRTTELTERIRQVQGWVDHLDLTPERARQLRVELLGMRAQLFALDTQLNGIRGWGGVEHSHQHMEGQRAHHERADRIRTETEAQDGNAREKYDELREEKRRLESENERLQRDEALRQQELERARTAEREATQAEADVRRQLQENDAAQEPYRRAHESGQEAARLRAEQDGHIQNATRLEAEAQAIRTAQGIADDITPVREQLERAERQITEADQAFHRAHYGDMIDMPDHPYGPRLAVMGVDENGVLVWSAGGTEHRLSPAEIPDAAIRSAAEQALVPHDQAAPLRTELEGLESRQQQVLDGADLTPDALDRDPATITEEASGLRRSASEMQGQIDAAQANSTHNGQTNVPGELTQQASELQRLQTERTAASGEATDRVSQLETQIRTLSETREANDTRLTALDPELARQREILAMEEQQGLARPDWTMDGPSSGNATGAVGSAWKDAFAELWSSFLSAEQAAAATPAQGAPTHEEEQQAATNGFGSMIVNNTEGLQNWQDEGLRARYEDHWRQIGDRQANIEQLMELYPPVSFEELTTERQAAVDAYERYAAAHHEAYKAYVAEQQVAALAAETEALGQSATPLREETQRQAAPLQQSLADEQQRQTILAGGNTEMGEDDGSSQGVVGRLISLLAEHADDFDEQPQAGSTDAGPAIENASGNANSTATERMGQATSGSEQQRAFLDQAIATRALQEQQICSDIVTVENKHQEELGILEEIRQIKAQRLSERDAARSETEGHAGTFNTGVEQIRTWATDYSARKENLES